MPIVEEVELDAYEVKTSVVESYCVAEAVESWSIQIVPPCNEIVTTFPDSGEELVTSVPSNDLLSQFSLSTDYKCARTITYTMQNGTENPEELVLNGETGLFELDESWELRNQTFEVLITVFQYDGITSRNQTYTVSVVIEILDEYDTSCCRLGVSERTVGFERRDGLPYLELEVYQGEMLVKDISSAFYSEDSVACPITYEVDRIEVEEEATDIFDAAVRVYPFGQLIIRPDSTIEPLEDIKIFVKVFNERVGVESETIELIGLTILEPVIEIESESEQIPITI